MSGLEPTVRAWMDKADHDLLNIENNLAAPRIPWDTVCFHCQQVVEKLLKALLIAHGRELVRTHDLVALLAQCVDLEPDLRSLEADCRRLTYFGAAARYPDALYELEETDGREMVGAMRRVRQAITGCLTGR